MTQYLLDTNVLLHLANEADGWQSIVSKMDAAGSKNLFLSVGTVYEISRMVERAKFKKKVLQSCVEMLSLFKVEPLIAPMAALAGSVHATLMNRGFTIGETDTLIAATAMYRDFVLVSDDRLMAEIPTLQLENWVRA